MELLTFELVVPNDLIKGQRYLITRNIIEETTFDEVDIATFEKFIPATHIWPSRNEEKVFFRNMVCFDENETHNYKFGSYYYKSRYYYKMVPQKEKIQEAMESRALNAVLNNIIGDDSFVY